MESTTRKRDMALAFVGMAVAMALGFEADAMIYPSKVFPLFVSGIIFVLSAIIGIRAIARPGLFATRGARFIPSLRSLVVTFIAVVYVFLIDVLGFYLSSFICVVLISIVTDNEHISFRRLMTTVLATFIFLIFVYLIFSFGFKSTIPSGKIFEYF